MVKYNGAVKFRYFFVPKLTVIRTRLTAICTIKDTLRIRQAAFGSTENKFYWYTFAQFCPKTSGVPY